jgi:hypothetical protein
MVRGVHFYLNTKMLTYLDERDNHDGKLANTLKQLAMKFDFDDILMLMQKRNK